MLVPHFTPILLRRSLILWIVGRAFLFAAAGFGMPVETPQHLLRLGIPAAAVFVAAVAFAGWTWAKRTNEDRFLASLGVSPSQLAAHLTTLPIACEIGMRLLLRP